jgi:hypothetical protein
VGPVGPRQCRLGVATAARTCALTLLGRSLRRNLRVVCSMLYPKLSHGLRICSMQLKTNSSVDRMHNAKKYVLLLYRWIASLRSHQGAAVIAARLRVGLLPFGGAHVVRDRTAGGAGVGRGRTANHRLCRSRREYGRDDREDSVRPDLSYVENWSMLSDLATAAKTVGAVCRGSGAY